VDIVAYDARGWHYSVGVVDLQTGKIRIVVEDGGGAEYSPTGHLLFARGDAILAMPFDLGKNETHGAPVAVWGGLSTPYSFVPATFQVTDDGSLFYRPGQLGGERTLATIDASGKVTPWSSDHRAVDNSPAISPDGRRFVCTVANNRGLDEIWMSSLDAPGMERLETDPDADAGNPTWSPDGRRIAYVRSAKDNKDGIYTQAADGGAASLILKHDEYVPVGWMPDGSALVVTHRGLDFNSAALLTVAGAATDSSRVHPIPLGRLNVFGVSLSPDGRRLAYIGDENGPAGSVSVVELRPDGSVSRAVPVPAESPQELHWASNGSALYIRDGRGRILKAAALPGAGLAFAPPVELWDGDKLGIWLWNVLPDGRLFVGLKNDNEGEPTRFNVVFHWTEELKRKMRAAGK
jgi:sugar lactone lactonase YvrE